MNFVLFMDAKGQRIGGIQAVREDLELPENAIEFNRFYPTDENQTYMKKYRVGKRLNNIGDIANIDPNLIEAFAYLKQYNLGGSYSIYIEDKTPYFNVLDRDTTLVENRAELMQSFVNELQRDGNISKSGRNR